MSATENVLEAARNYVAWDPDLVTREIVKGLLDNNDVAKLTPLLTKRIQFGTAGLRAAMGPGYDKMNDLVILQTSQGLVRYLESHVENAKEKVRLIILYIVLRVPLTYFFSSFVRDL